MPRRARDKSETGIYHVMLRGINRQEIFHDDHDRIRFLETLERYKKEYKIKIHGWCLMGNHIHLLMEQGDEELSNTIKRIGISFAWYYNWKYKHTGHLFQDRYQSEKVEDDAYLLTVIRYIHQNPVKACIEKNPLEYRWSSCSSYYGNKEYPIELTDRELVYSLFSEGGTAVKRFIEYNEQDNEDICIDYSEEWRMNDDEARTEIMRTLNEIDITQIQRMPKVKRDEMIRKVKGIEGISQRQIARILGISPNIIFKA